MDLNSSAERCEAAPTPEEPKVSLAGLALASAMSSPMFAAATRGWAVTIYAAAETSDTGANRSTFFSVSEAVELMSSVYPSAGDWATKSAPRWPLAPGLFSTITCCPQRLASCGPRRRASASAPPPGGKGTTTCTGFAGKACATTLAESRTAKNNPVKFMRRNAPAAILALLCGASRVNVVAPEIPGRGHEEQRNVWFERRGVRHWRVSSRDQRCRHRAQRSGSGRLGDRGDHRSAHQVCQSRGHRRARPLSDPRASGGELQRLGARLWAGRFRESKKCCRQN